MSEVLTPRHLHDLGKFLLTLVMVWAYFSFSQFLIIWAGNLPDEIPWYLVRLRGGWQYVALLLVVGHFALPFALLLSRDLKRNFKLLAGHRALRAADAAGGSLLAGGAGFPQEVVRRELDGFHRADGAGRHLAGLLPDRNWKGGR